MTCPLHYEGILRTGPPGHSSGQGKELFNPCTLPWPGPVIMEGQIYRLFLGYFAPIYIPGGTLPFAARESLILCFFTARLSQHCWYQNLTRQVLVPYAIVQIRGRQAASDLPDVALGSLVWAGVLYRSSLVFIVYNLPDARLYQQL